MGNKRQKELSIMQDRLGYRFRDVNLLNSALTHSSYANEKGMTREHYNERLEFLGDAVLQMVISEYLYNGFTGCSEGVLTKMRASLVMGQALGAYAVKHGLGEFLLLGKGEEMSGGRQRNSLLADAFEALIGALYIDGGYPLAKRVIKYYINERAPELDGRGYALDHKTMLQEKVQSLGDCAIEYRLISEKGPDHDKTFRVNVYINNSAYGDGVGKSKKEAEQKAAKNTLKRLRG